MMFRKMKIRGLRGAAVVAGISVMALFFGSAAAFGASISNGNSTVTFNPSASSFVTPFISQWVVDGVDQYGGSPAGGEDPGFYLGAAGEEPVNLLPVLSSSFSGATANVSYQGDGFTVAVKDVLTGGSAGSGSSTIVETFTVDNTSSSPLAFDLADFVNLNLNATPIGDTVVLSDLTSAQQSDSFGTKATFTFSPSLVTISESTNGNSGPFLEQFGTFEGDAAFGLIWGSVSGANTIDADSTATYTINETLTGGQTSGSTGGSVVPLPNSAASALLGLAGLGAIGILRRMRKMVV
jgi:hypothetical protein